MTEHARIPTPRRARRCGKALSPRNWAVGGPLRRVAAASLTVLLGAVEARAQPPGDDPQAAFTQEEIAALLSETPSPAGADLVARFRERIFERNIRFIPGQDARLQQAVVAIAGGTTEVGWLATELLVRLGVGTLRVTELGEDEAANAPVAGARRRGSIPELVAYLRELNPTLRLEVHDATPRDVPAFVKGASLVIDALHVGAPRSQLPLHQAARAARVPIIEGRTLGDGARIVRYEPDGPSRDQVMGPYARDADPMTLIARAAAGPMPDQWGHDLATGRRRAAMAQAALKRSAPTAEAGLAALLADAALARIVGLPGLPPAPKLTFLDLTEARFHTGTALRPELWMNPAALTYASAKSWAPLEGKIAGVIGLGAIGGRVSALLAETAAALAPDQSWGLRLVDGDNYDWPNIQRQLGATTSTIGRPKVEVLAELLRARGPRGLDVDARGVMLDAQNLSSLLESVSVVVPALDVFAEGERARLCEEAGARGLPFVDYGPFGRGAAGGVFPPEGERWSTLTGNVAEGGMSDVERLLRHSLMLSGGLGLHLGYMGKEPIRSQIDIENGRAPSLASSIVLAGALTAHRVLQLLTKRPVPSHLSQLDPSAGGRTRIYPPRSNSAWDRRAWLHLAMMRFKPKR